MNKKKFKKNIQHFISLIFLGIIISSCLITFLTIKKIAYPIFLEKELQLIRDTANNIALKLKNKVQIAEDLSVILSDMYQVLEKKESVFKKVIPGLLNHSGYKNIIAGGGIWPEPYTFYKKDFYRSFFWGRDKKGNLVYYDNYNEPTGKGYFHEEWYVPVKFLTKSKVYWSRLYIDSYSKQPMITCSSPIKIKGKFLGVATVDLKLDGLEKIFSYYEKKVQGYIFVLDRENNFLYFPQKIKKEHNNLSKFAAIYPQFNSVKKIINKLDSSLINLAKNKNKKFDDIADKISKNSYQITKQQANLITTVLTDPLNSLINNKIFKINDDLIFNGPAIYSIFYMPDTYWKIGIVVPEKLVNNLIKDILRKIIFYLLFSLILILSLGYFIIKQNFLVPLGKITSDILNNYNKRDFYIDYNKNNELGRLVYYLNDRTKQLKESENYAKAIFEQSPISIQIFDKNGIAVDANEAWEKLWDTKKEDFNGKYCILKDKIFQNSKEFEYIVKVFKGSPAIINNFEYKLKSVTGKGNDKILNVIMFPIKSANGDIERVVIMQEDITNKVKMEKTLEKIGQLKALGEVSAGIAHDFNNILTGILLNIEMLEIKLQNDETLLKFLNKIKDSIDSAKHLINKIKMVSRNENYIMQPCRIDTILKQTVKMVDFSNNFNIEVKIDIQGNNFWIKGEQYSLKQLFMNLIINARDAIISAKREKGILQILLKSDKYITLEISDNGIGIPKHIKEKIFEPFFTTKQKTDHRGTGLGLAIVYNVVSMHNGEIKVDSVENKGTTFTINFPLIEYDAKESIIKEEKIKLNPMLHNQTILFVDDEDNIRETGAEMLNQLGFNVITAKNGKEAVNIILDSKNKIDIVLIDWDMPVMNGEEAISLISNHNKKLPIFIVSGAISEKIEKLKNKLIVTDIITKPFNKEEIIKILNENLQNQKNSR